MDQNRRLYFIEMNARIRVERSVPLKMVADVDLVKSQILIAAGERMEQVLMGPIVHRGHAIECRINAGILKSSRRRQGRLRRLIRQVEQECASIRQRTRKA